MFGPNVQAEKVLELKNTVRKNGSFEYRVERNGKDATNIADGFRISGLGQLVEGAIESDRLVVFGD